MEGFLRALADAPPWLLVVALGAGGGMLWAAFERFRLSLPGAGYKGITRGYWVALLLLLLHGVTLTLLGAVGLVLRLRGR